MSGMRTIHGLKTTAFIAAFSSALVSVTGCAGTTISPNTPVHESSHTASATLVIGEITHPRDLTVSAPFYVAMQREAVTQLDQSHLAERDLTPNGVAGKAYALRYRVVDDHVTIANSGMACHMALVATGSLILVPIFFDGLCTRTVEHTLSVEARVFDLDGATVSKIRDDNSNELLNVYDTSTMAPVLRREYPVKVVITSGIYSIPQGDAVIEYEKREAAEAVRQVLAQSLSDVGQAVGTNRRVASR